MGRLSLLIGARLGGSDGALDGEDKGAESQLGGRDIHLVQLVEDGIHASVIDDGEDGRGNGWPCVGGVMGLARLAATSLYLSPSGEAAAVEQVELLDDSVVIGLVKGYKNRFHIFCCQFVIKKKTINTINTIFMQV